MTLIALIRSSHEALTALVTSFVLVFTALKYKLDQASYHKALFEERFAIFNIIHKALISVYKNSDWHELTQELLSINRKSYFLFSDETYSFIDTLNEKILEKARLSQNISHQPTPKEVEVDGFLYQLLNKQELSKKFPELKIDTY